VGAILERISSNTVHLREDLRVAVIVSCGTSSPFRRAEGLDVERSIPTSGDWSKDTAALRLRDLTDYVYQMITTPQPR
jgi:hypothetical protein